MGHTLDDLALLVDVVRAGGVRAVARAQGVPRSTVSRRLQRLETSLGVGLKRKGAGLELSEAAQSSFERLARLVDEARAVSDELGNRQPEPRGVLRLATTMLFAEHLLPGVMAKYLAAHRQVRVEVLSSTDRLDLTAERVDVAIRSGPLEDLASWTSKKLGPATTVGLFASPAYLKRRGLPATLDALAEHDLLVSTTRAAGTQWVVQRRDRREPIRVLGRLHSTSENLLLSLCERGAGIVRAPAYAVADLLRRGKVVPVLESTWVSAQIHLVFPLDAPPRTRAFIDCALEVLGQKG
ncbi:MAG: LysR family transcriptional regulator [Archangium sp.]|nr:LysR family transcriptional regulator [Archangium sp.]